LRQFVAGLYEMRKFRKTNTYPHIRQQFIAELVQMRKFRIRITYPKLAPKKR
jgi:glutathionyl-hydroquinone reductase